MKKFLSLLLAICLLMVPVQAFAYVGDILPSTGSAVETSRRSDGTLVLKNDYIRAELHGDGTLTTAPAAAADSAGQTDKQKPFCEFITYKGYGYGTREIVHPASIRLKSTEFVNTTPNGAAKAIKAEYALTVEVSGKSLSGTGTVYHELVQLKETEASEGAWGVMTSVDTIRINNRREDFIGSLSGDMGVQWGYTLDAFSSMGHGKATDGPAIKMSRTIYNYDQQAEISTKSSVFTSKVENLTTYQSFPQGRDWCYNYITEVYVDGYTWANPFVGLSGYYKNKTIKAYLPDTVSVTPGSNPANTCVECRNETGYCFSDDEVYPNSVRFLWGFRDLAKGADEVPSEPDKVDISMNAQRLAAFAVGEGITVEYIADDAALNELKQQYGTPIAIISGEYESKNGMEFTFTGGAALLSPSVTATWDTSNRNNKLVIKKDGTVEQSGVSLNAPSFKFYHPKSGKENNLSIRLTKDGFQFGIKPDDNSAVIYVDIPYATAKLKQAAADAAGNLVFSGDIGFQTIFNGAAFSLEKLGYGLNEKNEFKVNGVHATGSFNTADLLTLELMSVEGEVNTFKGEERYAFSLELNAFDLFETEAELALERAANGGLIPDELWFYVKANPGIVLVPPVPVGQLNGGGAGFRDLAATVNGDYFAIPPLKLRGALTGSYLHLIEGTGNVVLGPSEISFKATDVGIVGAGEATQIIDSFGYTLKLNGQERTHKGTNYEGIYFAGSEELALALPSKALDIIALDSSVELGAFGGVNDTKSNLYLGIGANGTVIGRLQLPKNFFIPCLRGKALSKTNVELILGGQTVIPIRGVSVAEGMKQAFSNIDVYLGAMTQTTNWLYDVRAWAVIPNIIETNFRMGGGWDIEGKLFGKLDKWDWTEHDVEPVVQAVSLEAAEGAEGAEAAEAVVLMRSSNVTEIEVSAGPDETPYILLAFDSSMTEEQIRNALKIKKDSQDMDINWLGDDVEVNPAYSINADTDIIRNHEDGKEYRVAILRLNEGGAYQIDTGDLALQKSESASVLPFEKLNLSLNGGQLSGKIDYAETGTKYVLRTYFSDSKGGADYLIEEQEISDSSGISVTIPQSGALAPTGEYYVTSFLMTEKEVDLNGDGILEKTLVAIDSQQFDTPISYTNSNQPDAPQNVSLELAGNEVMTAEWTAVADVDGYAVRIYQKQSDGTFKDTGFGYDLDGNTTSIDMALTVGGEETAESPNLSANETYKVSVSAYKTVEGGKYYSAEAESSDQYLPQYTPLDLMLSVNGTTCTADENGVYHAYVGGSDNVLMVNSTTENATYKVTRMDTKAEINVNADGTGFDIPSFEGSLMFKIDGISDIPGSSDAKDVTSVFLLVSMDETAPVLTLSAPVFYADSDTGDYEITGMSEAGSEILYGDNKESVHVGSDGTFTISGNLEDNSGVLALFAQDGAGNRSASQFALITKQNSTVEHKVTVTTDGNGTASASLSTASEGMEITLSAAPATGCRFKEWQVISGNVTIIDNRFTMPDSNVEIKAIFEKNGDESNPHTHVWSAWTSNGDGTHTRICSEDSSHTETASCSGGTATCTEKAKCKDCGMEYGEIGKRHDLVHHKAQPATVSQTGSIEYWQCSSCGKYFADSAAAREIAWADIITAKVTGSQPNANSPHTGDSSRIGLWLFMLCASAGAVAVMIMIKRRKGK